MLNLNDISFIHTKIFEIILDGLESETIYIFPTVTSILVRNIILRMCQLTEQFIVNCSEIGDLQS